MTENVNQVQSDLGENSSKENKINTEEEKKTVKLTQETQSGEDSQESTTVGLIENKAESETLHGEVTDENYPDQGQTMEQTLDELGTESQELSETALEEACAVKVWFSFVVFFLRLIGQMTFPLS